jgi:hypothetical protein
MAFAMPKKRTGESGAFGVEAAPQFPEWRISAEFQPTNATLRPSLYGRALLFDDRRQSTIAAGPSDDPGMTAAGSGAAT